MWATPFPILAIFLLIQGLNCFQLICDNRSIDTQSVEWCLSNGWAGALENRLLISMYFNNVGGNGLGRRCHLIDWFYPLCWVQGRPPLPPPPMFLHGQCLNDTFWADFAFRVKPTAALITVGAHWLVCQASVFSPLNSSCCIKAEPGASKQMLNGCFVFSASEAFVFWWGFGFKGISTRSRIIQ